MWFVTHKNSKPTKGRKRWDFLAVCADKAEAERLAQELPGSTGIEFISLNPTASANLSRSFNNV